MAFNKRKQYTSEGKEKMGTVAVKYKLSARTYLKRRENCQKS